MRYWRDDKNLMSMNQYRWDKVRESSSEVDDDDCGGSTPKKFSANNTVTLDVTPR